MPSRLLFAYVRMLPSLQAEQSLLAVTQHAVGSGSLRKGVAEAIVRRWQRTVLPAAAPILRPQSREQFVAQTGAVGIAVKFERTDANR